MKLGIDLGGSHIGIGLISDDFKLVQTTHIDFQKKDNSKMPFEEIQTILRENIFQMLEKQNITKEEIELIGVAAPGVPKGDRIERIVNLRLENLLVSDLLPDFKDKKIIVQNDGKCAAMAEKKMGSLQEEQDCIFLCLGTGIGAGVFLGGKMLRPNKVPGFEVGHIIIKEEGIPCRCGNRGCFETYGSMRKFKTDLCNILDLNPELSGERLKEILTNLKDNLLVIQVVDTYINDLVTGIINLVNLFAPETISIGGSFCYFEEFLFDKLQQKVQEATYLANDCAPKLKLAKLGNNAGILGSVLID